MRLFLLCHAGKIQILLTQPIYSASVNRGPVCCILSCRNLLPCSFYIAVSRLLPVFIFTLIKIKAMAANPETGGIFYVFNKCNKSDFRI